MRSSGWPRAGSVRKSTWRAPRWQLAQRRRRHGRHAAGARRLLPHRQGSATSWKPALGMRGFGATPSSTLGRDCRLRRIRLRARDRRMLDRRWSAGALLPEALASGWQSLAAIALSAAGACSQLAVSLVNWRPTCWSLPAAAAAAGFLARHPGRCTDAGRGPGAACQCAGRGCAR